ncbi:hypothetical protein N1851_026045 [Merluccius polli]|uniref:Endonuclease/exonuclease/phosphatase domain-containing protein n=1 Tax=Merluccius polli TaxID=89951 RepID=A0AA47MCU3_MERPO|nr:hypothetical protein N1851_026045 [Merluccius polli]
MASFWILLVLLLLIGDLLCTSGQVTRPTNTAVFLTYTREVLLALRFKGTMPPAGLPEAVIGSSAGGARRRKRGRKGGVRQRVRRRGNRPPLPSIVLSNVRSIRNKMDELRVHTRYSHEYREANILVFSETWLREDIPDSLLELEGFSFTRADREATSGKSRGGGLGVYVSNSWCSQYTVREKYCDPDLELLCLSMRPFYLPREYGNVICAVYVPPSANAARAANRLAECVHAQMLRTPGAPIFVLGDVNHCRLEPALPGFHQYVKCGTRNNKVLDKCYGNIKNAYRAKALPPLANSDHSTVQLMPTYKSVLKSSKPVQKTVFQWSEDSTETLKGCFLCTDWSIFHDLELNEATETVTDYINFCVDTIVPKKTIRHYPNNKPYITSEVKGCINRKNVAFKSGDRGGMAEAQKELNRMLSEARRNHGAALEESVGTMNTKGLWDHMKKSVFEKTVLSLANRILSDPSHFLTPEYELLPSGRRYRTWRCKSNRLKLSFLPTSIVLLNNHHIVHST